MGGYIYDQAWERERERLSGIEHVWDPGTLRHLEALGVREGWRCLEIGAGGGSMARWMAERVGPSGSVVATDMDTRYLEALPLPNLAPLKHDIVNDPLPEGEFDLVHARLVLEHLPGRADALKRAVASVKPGGWIMIEDCDWGMMLDGPVSSVSMEPAPAARLFVRCLRACLGLMTEFGYDVRYGRRLGSELMANGLTEVAGEGRIFSIRGGSPMTDFYRLTLDQLRGRLAELGKLSARDSERALAMMGDPAMMTVTPLVIATWGRRPTE